MYANITDSLNALAKKIKADPNGKDIESALSNISVKLGGKKSVGNTVAHAIDNITEVVDIDTMHVVKHKSVTANGVYDASDDDADGYDQVTVNVTPSLGTKSITANGTYTASSDELDGYSSVTVNVASEKNAKFAATPAEFHSSRNLVSIDIPEGVTSLAANALSDKPNLTNVTIPSGVTSIGNSAFASCASLVNIEIPDSVTVMGGYIFSGCTALETITIHKAEGSITGAPWGAPNTTTVVWDG